MIVLVCNKETGIYCLSPLSKTIRSVRDPLQTLSSLQRGAECEGDEPVGGGVVAEL